MSESLDLEYPDHVITLAGDVGSWYVVGVWKTDEGYYLSTDTGCSCYSAFENHQVTDLTGPLTWELAREEIINLFEDQDSPRNLAVFLERDDLKEFHD